MIKMLILSCYSILVFWVVKHLGLIAVGEFPPLHVMLILIGISVVIYVGSIIVLCLKSNRFMEWLLK